MSILWPQGPEDYGQLKIDVLVESKATFEIPPLKYPHMSNHDDIVGHQIRVDPGKKAFLQSLPNDFSENLGQFHLELHDSRFGGLIEGTGFLIY